MGSRKTPNRTCTGCGLTSDKREFVRYVRTPDGDVVLDMTSKANGRGAYTCATLECFEAAVRKRRLSAALRVHLTEYDADRLREQLESALADRGMLLVKDGDASA